MKEKAISADYAEAARLVLTAEAAVRYIDGDRDATDDAGEVLIAHVAGQVAGERLRKAETSGG